MTQLAGLHAGLLAIVDREREKLVVDAMAVPRPTGPPLEVGRGEGLLGRFWRRPSRVLSSIQAACCPLNSVCSIGCNFLPWVLRPRGWTERIMDLRMKKYDIDGRRFRNGEPESGG